MNVLLVAYSTNYTHDRCAELRDEGAVVTAAGSGEAAVDLVKHERFDIIVLDASLPGMAAARVIQDIRSNRVDTPVLVLSPGAAAIRDGLISAGANDVVGAAVGGAALFARMQALARLHRGPTDPVIRAGDLALHRRSGVATAHGDAVVLTPKEFAILELLLLRRNVVLTKEAFIAHLYGDATEEPDPKIVDVFICKIRRKLALAGAPDVIGTVWGRGYVCNDAGSGGGPRGPAPHAPWHGAGHGTQAGLVLAPA